MAGSTKPLSLARNVRLVVVEDQVRLAAREVEQHLGEVAVRPCEPRAGVRAVIDVDRLVDQAKARSVLQSYASMGHGQRLVGRLDLRLR